VSAATPARAEIAEAFRQQVRGCAATGSAMYADFLGRAADDLAAGGVFADLVADYRGNALLDALPLRLLARIHAFVLAGEAPDLARFYPSAGGVYEAEPAWRALRALVHARRDELRDAALHWKVQTNEVRRSAVLLPGFLRVAAATSLPLRIREIGASGGLNLLFDRYRYELGPHRFGDAASRLVLGAEWDGPAPDLATPLRVADRRGCDLAPLDLADPFARRKLESFLWPELLERRDRLRAAIAIVAEAPPAIDRAPAGEWVEAQVAPEAGLTTVLFHSVVWWYVPEAERTRITAHVESAGARATRDAPLAWLRMEGARLDEAELRLRLWPSGDDRLLAAVHYHGAWVRWIG
jgi:hypothetical protein